MTEISNLQPGERAYVQGFGTMPRSYRQKLLAMGLTRGTPFQVIRIAPLGDPIEIHVRGFALSVRKKEIKDLQIERC